MILVLTVEYQYTDTKSGALCPYLKNNKMRDQKQQIVVYCVFCKHLNGIYCDLAFIIIIYLHLFYYAIFVIRFFYATYVSFQKLFSAFSLGNKQSADNV